MGILVSLILVGSVCVMQQQQVYAPRNCGACIGDFQKLTGEFVVKVANAVIGDPNISQGPQPHLTEFRKLTAQFERDVINAVLQNPPDGDKILRLQQAYADKVLNIFLGGPDTIPGLLNAYNDGVKRIFGLGPR